MADPVIIQTREGGGSGGGWGILGVVLGVVIVGGIIAFVLFGGDIASWWGDGGSHTTTIETPAVSTTMTTP